MTTGIAIITALTGFLGFALVQAGRARTEQGRALDMARVAIAGEWLQQDPTNGALVLLEVTEPENTRFAPRRMSEALSRGFSSAEYHHTESVHSVAVSPDGSRVLTTSGKAAMLWEARPGRLLHTLAHDEVVIAGAFDPTGRFVVTRSGEVGEYFHGDRAGNRARVWNVETGTLRFIVTHGAALNGAVFSQDGQLLVTISDDDTAQLWDINAGRLRMTFVHPEDVEDATFSPDGKRLVTVSAGSARVWTPDSNQPVATFGNDTSPESPSFSPDGTCVITAGREGVQSWDASTWREPRLFAHDLVRRAWFSPDGRQLLSASDHDARVWDFERGAPMFEEPIQHRNLVFAGFSEDGSLVITASGQQGRRGYGSSPADNAVRYWDARTGKARRVTELKFGTEVMTLAFGPGRRTVVLNSGQRIARGRNETLRQDTTARLWDLNLRDRRLQWTHEDDASASGAAFSADGRRLLTVSGTSARLWDAETKKPRATLDHGKDVVAAAFTEDGHAIVSASRDGTARVWDGETGQERFVAKHQDAVDDAILVASGRLLATISRGKVRLWTLTQWRCRDRNACVRNARRCRSHQAR